MIFIYSVDVGMQAHGSNNHWVTEDQERYVHFATTVVETSSTEFFRIDSPDQ